MSNLEIVRQFCAASITRIHSDEYRARGDKRDLYTLEHKPLCLKNNIHNMHNYLL